MANSNVLIVSRVAGGFGNQLFQYAAGRALARAAGGELALDLSSYASQFERRAYGLQRLNLDVAMLVGSRFDAGYGAVGFPAQTGLAREASIPVITETDYDFDPMLMSRRGSSYLFGFWQSWRYFSDIADDLRRDLRRGLAQAAPANLLSAVFRQSETVAVHVRRGDYLDPKFRIAFGVCEVGYYRAAFEFIRERTKSPTFLLFSDDPDWCSEHLADADCRIVSRAGGDPVEDLMLMARCSHHILSNSSFGWWGAWLGAQTDSIVIAPMPWFTEAPHVRDLVLPHWIRLNRQNGSPWEPINGNSGTALASVVIRATGDPGRLRRAINAVRAQDYPNKELILALRPGLGSLADLLRSDLDGVAIVNAKGNTPNAVRNSGVSAARGQWIAFLDDGDSWDVETLRTQVETAQLSSADAVICRTTPISDGDKRPPMRFPPAGSPQISLRKLLEEGGAIGGGSNTVIRLSALRESGGLDEQEAPEDGLGVYSRLRSKESVILHWSRLVKSPRAFVVPHG